MWLKSFGKRCFEKRAFNEFFNKKNHKGIEQVIQTRCRKNTEDLFGPL